MWMIIDYLNNIPNYNFQQHLLDAIAFLKQPAFRKYTQWEI
ncbi:hypothetical protein [Hydrotalea flava]|nr:hypothetical protein [Hydrotalea flava]